MADHRDAAIAAFAGMENSLMELRSVTLLLQAMDLNRTCQVDADGNCQVLYDSKDEWNAQSFLTIDVENRVIALLKEFNGCIDVWGKGKGHV